MIISRGGFWATYDVPSASELFMITVFLVSLNLRRDVVVKASGCIHVKSAPKVAFAVYTQGAGDGGYE